jgi:hypothetical protein
MRTLLVLSFAILFLASITSTPLRAQFQQPTDEELKMTADPKAPGADAVYLNIEEIANDPIHFQSYYARIKVLTEKGKELATVEVPYLRGDFKITDIKARTIHPDGTVVPLQGKPEDLLVSKSKDLEIGRKVFTLPSVEVGSILEYRYELRYDDNHYSSPTWEIQRPYFVHKAHYAFTPFKAFMPTGTPDTSTSRYLVDDRGHVVNSLIWWNRLPPGVTVQTSVNGSYTVDVTDVPPIPDEEWMPPINSFLYKVFFYYKSASSAQEFWLEEAKQWSKDVDKFAEQSPGIHAAVAAIVAPTDSDEIKAKKLYIAAQALDNTDYSRKKGESELKQMKLKEAKHAEDTWKQKSGDSEDIAMLYLAMARAAGLQAYAIKIVARNRGMFDPSYMSLSQLDDTLVLVGVADKGVLTDPGEKMCPFGLLNWRHSGASGLRQSPQGPGYVSTPELPYGANTITRVGDLTLDPQGNISGEVRVIMTVQEALRWRQESLEYDDAELKKDFDRGLEQIMPEGVEGHVDHFLSMKDPDSALMAVVDVKGALGTATAKRLLLPGFFFDSHGHLPFVSQEKRQEAVDMHYGDREAEQITYHLPAGTKVEGAPADSNIPWTAHAAYVTKTITKPDEVTIARTFARAFSQAKPDEYQDLRGFYQKIAAADQQQLVLTIPPQTAKAN